MGKSIQTKTNWDEATTFYPDPPIKCSKKKITFAQETCVELCGDQLNPAGAKVPVFATKWVVFDEIQQKIVLLSEHDRKMRKKEMKWNTCQDNKKLIMDAVHRQLDMIRNQNWNLRTDTPHRVALMVI